MVQIIKPTPEDDDICTETGQPPGRTWDDYLDGCFAEYGSGYRDGSKREIFQRGMRAVFALLEEEFPPAEVCKAAPELLEACRRLITSILEAPKQSPHQMYAIKEAKDAISKATRKDG